MWRLEARKGSHISIEIDRIAVSAVQTIMLRFLMVFVLSVLVLPVGAGSFRTAQEKNPKVKRALVRHASTLKHTFQKAGAAWPIKGGFLRAYKLEGVVELWAAPRRQQGRWVRVTSFPICASSGRLGPKAREGDGQVPEGVYFINRFNPRPISS